MEEKYVKTGKLEEKWIKLIDYQREVRHEEQYNLSFFSTEDEAKKAIEYASKFLERMQLLLNFLIKSE